MPNTNRWLGTRGVYDNRRERLDTAEQWVGVAIAARAVGVGVDARKVKAEMDARLAMAMEVIDNTTILAWYETNDNGVAAEVISAPMPASAEEELPY